MKKKIFFRLISRFISMLLLFSVLIALVFSFLFTKQTEDLHLEELTNRSELISETMAEYFADGTAVRNGHGSGMMGGYGAFLKFLNEIAGENVWILDENSEASVSYHQTGHNVSPLPEDAAAAVTAAYQQRTGIVYKKSSFFQLRELTIATPILVNDSVVSVVLMHSQVSETHGNQINGYLILLLSILLGVVIALLISVPLAKSFVQPIQKMQSYIRHLIAGNYRERLTITTHDELEELADKLTVLSSRLQQAQTAQVNKEKAEKTFLSQISHELRTPVMVIKGSLEALADGVVEEGEEQLYLQQLLQEAAGLERLVTDLIELSRLQSTEFQLELAPVDILDCLTDGLRSYRQIFQQRQQQVVLKNELTQKQLIQGDYLRLTQVVKILLDNAAKYAPAASEVLVTLQADEAAFTITVKNETASAAGLSAQQLLQSFQRGRDQQKVEGMGLGLAIAQQVVKRHQGRLTISPEQHHFIAEIWLPFNK